MHYVTCFLLYLVAFFIFFSTLWIKKNFGSPSMEALLFHLSFSMELVVDAPYFMIKDFVIKCILPSIILSLFGASFNVFIKTYKNSIRLALLGSRKILVCLILVMIFYFGKEFSFITFIQNKFGEDYFSSRYVFPVSVEIESNNPKNLVLIYLESIEDSYKSTNIFGRNLLASIDAIPGKSFTKYRQVPGAEWTAAAVIATQCGIPLKIVSTYSHPHAQGENIKYVLPGAICLGDILNNQGYYNVLMSGANLKLAGIDRFAQSHGYHEIYGALEWKKDITLNKDISEWGLYDDAVFRQAKIKLKKLHDAGQPFNLTVMTIDTHGPSGKISRFCAQKGAKTLDEVIECSAAQAADFIQFIIDSGYMKDTNIVVIGDHLIMSSTLDDKLKTIAERMVFNSFISNQAFTKNREEIIHFDLFPTILDYIGFNVKGGRLGLGYSGFSKQGALPPENRYNEMLIKLLNYSDVYLGLWKKSN